MTKKLAKPGKGGRKPKDGVQVRMLLAADVVALADRYRVASGGMTRTAAIEGLVRLAWQKFCA